MISSVRLGRRRRHAILSMTVCRVYGRARSVHRRHITDDRVETPKPEHVLPASPPPPPPHPRLPTPRRRSCLHPLPTSLSLSLFLFPSLSIFLSPPPLYISLSISFSSHSRRVPLPPPPFARNAPDTIKYIPLWYTSIIHFRARRVPPRRPRGDVSTPSDFRPASLSKRGRTAGSRGLFRRYVSARTSCAMACSLRVHRASAKRPRNAQCPGYVHRTNVTIIVAYA